MRTGLLGREAATGVVCPGSRSSTTRKLVGYGKPAYTESTSIAAERGFRMIRFRPCGCLALIAVLSLTSISTAKETAAQRGYRLLTTKPYLPPDFQQDVFDETWRVWEQPARTKAEGAASDERRAMAFSRYGLTPRPEDPTMPLQYVVDSQGNWCMSCLACHQGKVGGRVVPGVANSHFALQTLTEEIRQTKLRLKKPLTRMDVGSMFMPLGGTHGTTNAVMFGVVLMSHRDVDLNVQENNPLPTMTHHDHDAPAWWLFRRKSRIYIDGFALKTHRALMQFTLVKENGPEVFPEREDDFRDIFAYLQSLEPPKYPYEIDRSSAEQGRGVFNQHCASCHGTYGVNGKYPEKCVPIEEVATDRVRHDALLPHHREAYGKSWFTHYGRDKIIVDPGGYVAPPLDGVWATSPYFHNGSVPTLWHVLHPSERPTVWQRTENGYDPEKVGLESQSFDRLPPEVKTAVERRRYFNTRQFGKSAAGHDFPDALDDAEKIAVLEYLKTL